MDPLLTQIAIDLGRPIEQFSEFEQLQLNQWLEDVTGEIQDRLAGAAPISAPTYDRVRRAAVVNRASRPDFGVLSTEVAIDDGRVVTRYERGTAASLMTDDWWAMLGLTNGRRSSFSINPYHAPVGRF